MITPKEAKELTLEIWRYLRDHPEITCKSYLPDKLRSKIQYLKHTCPLCELFRGKNEHPDCSLCPLKSCHYGSMYNDWTWAPYKVLECRQKAAAKIVELVEAWNIEEGADNA